MTGIAVSGGLYTVKGAAGILLPGATREVTFVPVKPLDGVNSVKVTIKYAEIPAFKTCKSRTVICAVL